MTKKILITNIGHNDPIGKNNTIGPLLACVFKIEPEKIFFLYNKDNEYNYFQLIEYLIKEENYSSENLIKIETNIVDASNDREVNKNYRNYLFTFLEEFKKLDTYINITSGTPQMAKTFEFMIANEFIKAQILTVKTPDIKKQNTITNDKIDSNFIKKIKESEDLEKLKTRVITKQNLTPYKSDVLRFAANILIKNYNYLGAIEILYSIEDKVNFDNVFLIPLLNALNNLINYNFKSCSGEIQNLINQKKIHNKLIDLLNDLLFLLNNKNAHLLLYSILINSRILGNDFTIQSGLLREKILIELVEQYEKEFEKALKNLSTKDSRTLRILDEEELKSQYIDLYNIINENINRNTNIENNFNSGPYKTAFICLSILQWLKLKDNNLNEIYELFKATSEMANNRNIAAHNFKVIEPQKIEEQKKHFKNIQEYLYKNKNIKDKEIKLNLLEEINNELSNMLKTWYRY